MISHEELVAVGRYNKAHGVGGELSATVSVPFEALDGFSCLISDIEGIYVPFFIEAWRAKTAGTALLKLENIDSEQDAALLTGKDIFVLRQEWTAIMRQEANDDAGGLSATSFLGFSVVCNGRPLGTITDVDQSTANVLFQISTTAKQETVLLPAASNLIDNIDVETRSIAMSVPESLLRINE